jgi:hypothetical protein
VVLYAANPGLEFSLGFFFELAEESQSGYFVNRVRTTKNGSEESKSRERNPLPCYEFLWGWHFDHKVGEQTEVLLSSSRRRASTLDCRPCGPCRDWDFIAIAPSHPMRVRLDRRPN